MKTRRSKKADSDEWGRRARAILDRRKAAPQTIQTDPTTTAPRRKVTQRLRDRAREEWMKWAEIVVDHIIAPKSDTPEVSKEIRTSAPIEASLPAELAHEPSPPLPQHPSGAETEKPGREEWIKWAHVVVDRLTTCVRIYSKPPYEDVFMADKERQEKNGKAVDLLRRVHALTDDADTPTDSLLELEHHDERVIAGLKVLLREMLTRLPELSTDMQKLLKSPWLENCNGRLADELFRGPLGGHEPEGIGSGHPQHGRLPESLQNLLEREEVGEGRHPREALRGPHAHAPRWQGEANRRWAEHNNHLIRTAGRVE